MLLVNWEHPGVAFYQKIEVTRSGENEESLMVPSYSWFSFNLFLSSSCSTSGSLPLMFQRFSCLLFEIFLLSFLSMKDCCFGWFGSFPQMLIWGWSSCCFFSCCKLMMRKSPCLFINERLVVPLVAPLSRHYGSSSKERLEGIFSFWSANLSALLFLLNFLLPRRLLFERQWVGWVARCRLHEIPAADVFCCRSF